VQVGVFEEPRPHTLVNRDFVKLRVAITDTGLIKNPGISEVRFFAMPNVSIEWSSEMPEEEVPFLLIGVARKSPYDLIWDLKNTTDMFFGYDRLYAEVEDKKGNLYRIDPAACVHFSVDRNQAVKDLRVHSFHVKTDPFEQMETDSDYHDLFSTLVKGNNEIRFLSLWDKTNLYFWIKVRDEFLYADLDTSRRERLFRDMDSSYRMLWLGDCIELCFDPFNDRPSARTEKQKEVLFSILELTEANNADFYTEKLYLWGGNIKSDYSIKGTVNNNTDVDSGYEIRVTIPWKDLGIRPQKDHAMGFDLFSMDFDDPQENAVRYAWSGVTRQNKDNPSEWGTLVLYRSRNYSGTWIIIAVILLLMIPLAWYGTAKSGRRDSPDLQEYKQKEFSIAVKRAIEFMKSNYGRDIGVKDMAKDAGLSQSYFSTQFKNETGKPASQYLTQIRIEKACHLLINTAKSITEIAFEVGFKEQTYFNKVFKEIKNITPLDFRKENATV
jgi:AraC-like DNA-binding protein